MGDESWMPLGSVEAPEDWDMFEPKPKHSSEQHASKKRKRNGQHHTSVNGINGHAHSIEYEEGGARELETHNSDEGEPEESQSQDARGVDREFSVSAEQHADVAATSPPATNGAHAVEGQSSPQGDPAEEPKVQHDEEPKEETSEKMELHADGQDDADDEEQSQPTRRITRALAAEHNTSGAATPPLSPNSTTSSIDSTLLQADPLFLLPPTLATNQRAPPILSRLGLPVEEFMETRRLLMLFIQKQEESVRAYEAVLGKLTKAKRMREKLWEWCRAEGHVGELSDGEDWIDAEAWGLAPDDLKKGKDEEDVEGQEDTGRKGKRRRRD